jgi:hypothetical protein
MVAAEEQAAAEAQARAEAELRAAAASEKAAAEKAAAEAKVVIYYHISKVKQKRILGAHTSSLQKMWIMTCSLQHFSSHLSSYCNIFTTFLIATFFLPSCHTTRKLACLIAWVTLEKTQTDVLD